MTMKLKGNGGKDNHAASCCSHLPTICKAARTQAAGNSCHPIKLNNLQVLGGSTCVQLAKQIHLLQDAGPSSRLLQFGCAPLTLWITAKILPDEGLTCGWYGSWESLALQHHLASDYRCIGKYNTLFSRCNCSLPMERTGAFH